jgi:hypothetical protein
MHHSGVSRRGNAEVCPHIVVPANAGTHNHRTLYCAKVVQQHPSTIGRGVPMSAIALTLGSPRARVRRERECRIACDKREAFAQGLFEN